MSEQNNFNAETQSRGDTERALAALEAVRAAADPLRGDFNAEAECPTN